VAEHTLMLMLAAARRVVAHDHAARRGGWTVRDSFETVELDGKTLLLVGFGRIGRRVGELALAIGMRLLVHDPHVAESTIIEAGATTAPDLDAALAAADVITLHLPASPQGPLIDARRLALMKPSAILVNAARGGLIDETALDLALRAGRLHGAALDVLAGEPPAPAHPLLVNERLTLSPHAAGLTGECAARMAVAAVRNILDFFAGTLDGALVVNRDALAP
jgi:D-3-phosphoglycerate dehydrogenase